MVCARGYQWVDKRAYPHTGHFQGIGLAVVAVAADALAMSVVVRCSNLRISLDLIVVDYYLKLVFLKMGMR